MHKPWSNFAKAIYRRTLSRKDTGKPEIWPATVARVVNGNLRIVRERFPDKHAQIDKESDRLITLVGARKGAPAGRGLWMSGSPTHKILGGAALNNCWFFDLSNWHNFVLAMDMLMLGGGVGVSVESRYISQLPKVKKDVYIIHKPTKDADFIVPDSREGWLELFRRTLEAFFVTGKGFSYSTVCIRGYGEPILGFGGTASGPSYLIQLITNAVVVLLMRQGKYLRSIDAADIVCATGEAIRAGDTRDSAIMVIGDGSDREFLKAKRWDLGVIAPYRAFANFSVVCDDIEDLHPLYWKTYEQGEAFGIINRKNMQQYGRMGEFVDDPAEGVNPCGEANLVSGEPCNLAELPLSNLDSPKEFIDSAVLCSRYAQRVTLEPYHNAISQSVIEKNRRIGVGITGCLNSDLFKPSILDDAYKAICKSNHEYAKELGIPESIKKTVVKPSGTMSKILDCPGEGIHAGWSRYMIQRVRFSANNPLIPELVKAGHHVEPTIRFDGSLDHNKLVVDFYAKMPDSLPCADDGFDMWKQLDTLMLAQKHWADQSVSVSIYYDKKDIPAIKVWLSENLQYLKTISFLCHSDHGYKQAPKEAITKEQYEKLSAGIKELNVDALDHAGEDIADTECAGGVCPVK